MLSYLTCPNCKHSLQVFNNDNGITAECKICLLKGCGKNESKALDNLYQEQALRRKEASTCHHCKEYIDFTVANQINECPNCGGK